MSGIAVGPERENAIDFSFHYILDYFDWVAPMPQQKEKWTAIFKPFSIPTWMFLILASGTQTVILMTSVRRICKFCFPKSLFLRVA